MVIMISPMMGERVTGISHIINFSRCLELLLLLAKASVCKSVTI